MATTAHPVAPTAPEQKLGTDTRSNAAELAGPVPSTQALRASAFMNALINLLTKVGLLSKDRIPPVTLLDVRR